MSLQTRSKPTDQSRLNWIILDKTKRILNLILHLETFLPSRELSKSAQSIFFQSIKVCKLGFNIKFFEIRSSMC